MKNITAFFKKVIMQLPFGQKIFLYFRKRLIFYAASSNSNQKEMKIQESYSFKVVQNYNEFLSIAKTIEMSLKNELVIERFKNNQILYILHNDVNANLKVGHFSINAN